MDADIMTHDYDLSIATSKHVYDLYFIGSVCSSEQLCEVISTFYVNGLPYGNVQNPEYSLTHLHIAQ